ncbi:sensor histidine kinase [Sphingomonas sp.]|uniref:sensor histidine kinase n=1 Tax=Sphingomonas sp. TaxID=28214 RepID=UPI0039C9508F
MTRPVRRAPRWRRLAILIRQRRLLRVVELLVLLTVIGVAAGSYLVISHSGKNDTLLTPPVVALLLVANLVPIISLMVFTARRVAMRRAAASPIGGGGRLHVRLVALFSVVASVPTLLVVVFASLLFQYGVQFWFSNRARAVLENSNEVAQAYIKENSRRLANDMVASRTDFRSAVSQASLQDQRMQYFVAEQIAYRQFGEAALIQIGGDGIPRLLIGSLDERPLEKRLPPAALPALRDGNPRTSFAAGDRVEATILFDPASRTYLYASRSVNPVVLRQFSRGREALTEYNALLDRSRSLQLQFNAALLLVSLLIVGGSIWVALAVADRFVRPVGELVGAARRVAGGDLSVRVRMPRGQDEVGTLALAFNRMTRRLSEQTGALVAATDQAESRRALIEAVLSGVTAGVVSVDADGCIRIVNTTAAALLKTDGLSPIGRPLAEVAPELESLRVSGDRQAVVQLASGGDLRTLAVKRVRTEDGDVLTFDDITQQLLDQRRAAWADVARRIAHEIKNPLTPIQLAAERLQRRYGREIQSDPSTFERLTQTIVRQVGDLRRMVDEFSSFARMPKPVFREEEIAEIARQALFLHEVAHPAVGFTLIAADPGPHLVCDRRQLGQALTNIVKNAVEAIEARSPDAPEGAVALTVRAEGEREDGAGPKRVLIELADNGIGLPPERERIIEPYMTTRSRGTGLGLAIVKKIVEEHHGTIAFDDRPGGGTIVRLSFDAATLAPLAGIGVTEDDDNGERERRVPELTRMKAD